MTSVGHRPDRYASLNQRRKEIRPVGVVTANQANLSGSGPVFDVRLPLNRGPNVMVMLEPNQTVEFIPSRKETSRAAAVLMSAAADVGCNADIRRAVRPVRHDVDPSAFHRAIVTDGGLTKRE